MSLIKSISGIRGTIGGKPGDNLTPIDAVAFAAAYGSLLLEQNPMLPLDRRSAQPKKVVITWPASAASRGPNQGAQDPEERRTAARLADDSRFRILGPFGRMGNVDWMISGF